VHVARLSNRHCLPISCNQTDAPLQLPPRCTQSVTVKPSTSNLSGDRSSPAGSTKTGGSKGGPSLLDLIEAGMLSPGTDNMRVTYKGNTYAGGLQSNGTILFNGERWGMCSSISSSSSSGKLSRMHACWVGFCLCEQLQPAPRQHHPPGCASHCLLLARHPHPTPPRPLLSFLYLARTAST
jgi:hypothetical protein